MVKTNKVRQAFVGVIASASLLFCATAASAQSCVALRTESNRLGSFAASLAAENWGSALVFGGCVATASNDFDRSGSMESAIGTLTACAAIGCALTQDYGNCISVNTKLFVAAIRAAQLDEQARDGC